MTGVPWCPRRVCCRYGYHLRLAHEAVDLRQAEAVARFALRGEERLEQSLAHVLRHARAVILDADADDARRDVMVGVGAACSPPVKMPVAGPDHNG